MDTIRDTLLAGLGAPDARTRALTARRLRQVDLADGDILDAALRTAADPTPLPDDLQPESPEDPFAAFFGQAPAKPCKTVGEETCDRLVETGVIGSPATVARLAKALDADPPPWLVKAVVKLLGETVWEDQLGAVRTLVPRLHAHDAPLYAVIVRFGEAEHREMVRSALHPYRSRAVNELLNHGASKALMEEALGRGLLDGSVELSEAQAADALALLVSWSSPWTTRVAEALLPSYPWALLVLGMSEPTAYGPRLQAWLEAGEPAPRSLVQKIQEVLKASPLIPDFPLSSWLRYAGTGVDVVRRWKAAAACQEPLIAFVRAWDEHPERAVDALVALAEADLHEPVAAYAIRSLGRDADLPLWTRDRAEAIAMATPPIPGLVDAITKLLLREPEATRRFVPALMRRYAAGELRELAERYIALCESRPVIRKPSRPGLIHEEREGVDPVPLQPLVHALGDRALERRLQDVLPYVRAAE